MTAAYPLDGEPGAAQGAVFHDGFDGILAARGGVAAGCWKHRRDAELVEAYGEDEEFFQKGWGVRGLMISLKRKAWTKIFVLGTRAGGLDKNLRLGKLEAREAWGLGSLISLKRKAWTNIFALGEKLGAWARVRGLGRLFSLKRKA